MNPLDPTRNLPAGWPAHGLDEQDRALVAALRRRFEPPPGLASVERSGPLFVEARPRSTLRWSRWLPLAAAAAAGIAWVVHVREDRGARPSVVGEPPLAGVPGDAGTPATRVPPGADALAGTAGTIESGGGTIERPDLAALYRSVAGQSQLEACTAEDELEHRLPDGLASPGLLRGPYPSAQWASSNVFASWPDGGEGRPALLVTDDEEHVTCCVDVRLPSDSGLRLFTCNVDGVFLAEITPYAEPRLLPLAGPECLR
jgi:hypothetical protein